MSADIDIDLADRQAAIAALGAVSAMLNRDGKKTVHPSGAYLQDVPVDPFTGLAAFDHEHMDELGYFKIDLLSQTVYNDVRDEDHLIDLMSKEPEWELLDEPAFVEQLPHIHNYYDLVQMIKPRSIKDLAIVLALQRPGKRHLIGRSRPEIEAEIWQATDQGYSFKASHACSYSALIVVKMNILVEQMLADI